MKEDRDKGRQRSRKTEIKEDRDQGRQRSRKTDLETDLLADPLTRVS